MDLEELCKKAVAAKGEVAILPTQKKNECLKNVADEIISQKETILLENAKDIAAATAAGMHVGLVDRLRLTDERIRQMAEGILQIIELPDPIGEILEDFNRPNGLKIKKVRVPLGVIGIIYESRPNVTLDAFGLTFKSGNVSILKGGSDAIHSNIAITKAIKDGLKKSNVTEDAIGLIENTDRETTLAFMKMNDYIDVLIPRGTAGLIKTVVNNSNIPVIETGSGNCHIFIDESADLKMAKNIIINAKTQRIGVCNAAESLVIHENIKDTLFPEIAKALKDKNVELRCDEESSKMIDCVMATEEDFAKEYLDLIMSVKTVKSLDEAIKHINKYSTGHSECIITQNSKNAEEFQKRVDSSCVYVNASTRFTDGFEFGFGAEIGISTQKLHARGPMGLKELTSYKYQITGDGQIR